MLDDGVRASQKLELMWGVPMFPWISGHYLSKWSDEGTVVTRLIDAHSTPSGSSGVHDDGSGLFFAARGGPAPYYAGGHNTLPDQCISYFKCQCVVWS